MSYDIENMSDQADAFHDHLDVCRQCREHPFDLCPNGVALMQRVMKGLADRLARVSGEDKR